MLFKYRDVAQMPSALAQSSRLQVAFLASSSVKDTPDPLSFANQSQGLDQQEHSLVGNSHYMARRGQSFVLRSMSHVCTNLHRSQTSWGVSNSCSHSLSLLIEPAFPSSLLDSLIFTTYHLLSHAPLGMYRVASFVNPLKASNLRNR